MRAYTLKNYLSNLVRFAGNNTYILEMIGEQTNYKYTFKIYKELSLTIDDNDPNTPKLFINISNIDFIQFKDKTFKPVRLEESIPRGTNDLFERSEINIFYEAQMYIKLFRLMKERVSFMFVCNDKYYYCYYIDGKALYIEEDEKRYMVKGTSLFHLSKNFPNYQILSVSQPLNRYSYGKFLDVHNEIAIKKGKELVKYKFDSRIE